MSHDTYDEHLKRGGPVVDPARVEAFKAHVRACPTCNLFGFDGFGYIDCPEGLRLARLATKPVDNR